MQQDPKTWIDAALDKRVTIDRGLVLFAWGLLAFVLFFLYQTYPEWKGALWSSVPLQIAILVGVMLIVVGSMINHFRTSLQAANQSLLQHVTDTNLQLRQEIEQGRMRNELVITQMRTDHSQQISQMRTEHASEISQMRTEHASEIAQMRAEHRQEREQTRSDLAEVKAEERACQERFRNLQEQMKNVEKRNPNAN